jgi:hypothetical protein
MIRMCVEPPAPPEGRGYRHPEPKAGRRSHDQEHHASHDHAGKEEIFPYRPGGAHPASIPFFA